MSRLLSILIVFALQGCATQRSERLAYREAFASVLAPQEEARTVKQGSKRPSPDASQRRARNVARWTWPVSPVTVTSAYGMRRHPLRGKLKQHQGIDLEARKGQLVVAASDGVVKRAGWNGGHGRQIELAHGSDRLTRYSHLSMMFVEPGTKVEAGDPIGLAGATGVATGPHLHFELWEDGHPVDPEEALQLLEENATTLDTGYVVRAR